MPTQQEGVSSVRIMIMAGGTGGHVFPALALAGELRAQGCEIFWLGVPGGFEATTVPAAGFAMEWVTLQGVRRSGIKRLLLAPLQIGRAMWQVARILRRRRPALVIGMGGFVSGPGGITARLLGIPLVIHEQNRIPGLTNRILARIANRVLVAYPDTLRHHAAIHVGNPVRPEIAAIPPWSEAGAGQTSPPWSEAGAERTSPPWSEAGAERISPPWSEAGAGRTSLNLLVVGGSLGAEALNRELPLALAALPLALRPQVRHQAGKGKLEATQAAYRAAGISAEVILFVEDMAAAYHWADLVVCRAGALTIAELTAAGRAAILVPYPYAVDDHQTANAEWLVACGAARLVPQQHFAEGKLVAALQQLLSDPAQLRVMAEQARAQARPHAAAQAAEYCFEVLGFARF